MADQQEYVAFKKSVKALQDALDVHVAAIKELHRHAWALVKELDEACKKAEKTLDNLPPPADPDGWMTPSEAKAAKVAETMYNRWNDLRDNGSIGDIANGLDEVMEQLDALT